MQNDTFGRLLKAALSSIVTCEGKTAPVIEEEFSDYRPIDGIQIAFRATQKVGPLSVERRVIDVKVNAPIDAALFQRPAS